MTKPHYELVSHFELYKMRWSPIVWIGSTKHSTRKSPSSGLAFISVTSAHSAGGGGFLVNLWRDWWHRCRRICITSLLRMGKHFWHRSHWKAKLCLCLNSWSLRVEDCLKERLQWTQLWGRSFVCDLMWIFSLPLVDDCKPQTEIPIIV